VRRRSATPRWSIAIPDSHDPQPISTIDHRDTIEKIFSHSSSGNIEWRQVLSLLNVVGTTTEEHNGKTQKQEPLQRRAIATQQYPVVQAGGRAVAGSNPVSPMARQKPR
jgi:hypothetical protein